MQSIDSIVAYVYRESKELLCNKEEIKSNDTLKQYKNL